MIPVLLPLLMVSAGLGVIALMAETEEPELPPGWTWERLSVSGTAKRLGLDNTPGLAEKRRLAELVRRVLVPLEEALGRQVVVTSGYRSAAVNAAVGGSSSSQHVVGEAVDFHVLGMSSEAVAAMLLRLGLPFHELIWYAPERGGHVHVGLRAEGINEGRIRHAATSGDLLPRRPTAS